MKTPHRILFCQFPLAHLAIAFAAGILVANYYPLRLVIWLSSCAVLSVGAALTLVLRQHGLSELLLLLAMLCAGASLALLDKPQSNANTLKQILLEEEIGEREPVVLSGVLDGPAEFASDRMYLNLRVHRIEFDQTERTTSGLVNVLAVFQNQESEKSYRALALRHGDYVSVRLALRRNDQFRNPGVSTLTEFLDRRGLDAVGFLKSPGSITKSAGRRSFNPLAWLYDWRDRLQTEIDAQFDSETAGVLDAALLGNRYNLTSGVTERFRAGGTFHVLVISGLHITFLGGLVFLFARRLTGNRYAQIVFSVAFVWSYSLAVGAETSVVRAALMFTFVTLASVVFRNASSLNALGTAALLILLRQPRDLFDPSLQLTFLSVIAIVVLAWPLIQKMMAIGAWHPTRASPYPPCCSRWLKWLSETLFWSEHDWRKELERSPHSYRLMKPRAAIHLERYRLQRPLRYVFCAVVVSLSVQLLLLPLLIIYFHRLSISSIALNIGVSALLAALALVASLALLVNQIAASLAAPLVLLANWINWLMVHSVDPFTKLGLDSIRIPEYSGSLRMIYGLYYLPLLVLMIGLTRWEPLRFPGAIRGMLEHRPKSVPLCAGVLQLLLIAFVVCHPWSKPTLDGRLHVAFLDVGQGDSALITMPDGTTLLVDGGGRQNFFQSSNNSSATTREMRSIGETVVSEYLWWRGLDRVDYVLATHADADHIDGLNDVVKNFSVRSAIVARAPARDPEFARFAETLKANGTNLEVVEAGDVLWFGSVAAKVLSPSASAATGPTSDNDDSLVLRLEFGQRSILLTGDIEKNAERTLLASRQNIASDVVKVPHHGSRTSSTEAFVVATHPRLAIISVGLSSMFGHPHGEVVERWQSQGSEVLTTGRCGTVSVSTDGNDLVVDRYVK